MERGGGWGGLDPTRLVLRALHWGILRPLSGLCSGAPAGQAHQMPFMDSLVVDISIQSAGLSTLFLEEVCPLVALGSYGIADSNQSLVLRVPLISSALPVRTVLPAACHLLQCKSSPPVHEFSSAEKSPPRCKQPPPLQTVPSAACRPPPYLQTVSPFCKQDFIILL